MQCHTTLNRASRSVWTECDRTSSMMITPRLRLDQSIDRFACLGNSCASVKCAVGPGEWGRGRTWIGKRLEKRDQINYVLLARVKRSFQHIRSLDNLPTRLTHAYWIYGHVFGPAARWSVAPSRLNMTLHIGPNCRTAQPTKKETKKRATCRHIEGNINCRRTDLKFCWHIALQVPELYDDFYMQTQV